MTGKNARHNAFLRLVSGNAAAFGSESRYPLHASKEMVIGRDPSCQVVLDAMMYRMVSRRHAAVRPLSSSPDNKFTWVICDLNSANGTYLNGKRFYGCQELQSGDRIGLGSDGPQFIFEYDLIPQATMMTKQSASLPSAANFQNHTQIKQPDSVSFTQLFPIISTGKDLTRKAYLVPGILTVVFVVLMFATVGRPQANQVIVASYIGFVVYYFVYQLCGKSKPWWVLIGTALTTALILLSPILDLFIFIFRVVLPGNLAAAQDATITELFIRMFFGAGLMEELLKALPILGAYFIGSKLPSPWRENIGVWEPLDGILLGTASALGFTLLETLGQYVPDITQNVSQQVGIGAAGQLAGLQLLIPRVLGSVAGHMAYSGYLGYFIGLAVLKPSKSWQILSIGYLSASVLHALWNALGSINAFLLVVVGVLAYAVLMAAILKARALSPTRSQNFATRFLGPK
ncbi:hypothetical protein ACX27_06545 [Nostoc piscinale CENA21]|uniref:FHA domain-containing protein n=1 Tax=Nostoc piscinale CENA21 TaxID=224013 RepID=A0A0M4T0N2_9NOSO|nr:PrsW family glutamic-type intramembrane protease [Nostoc piscinale]ALF52582.1 hypothetical protein ACX27_06545 [Nostoc piscinale CENA21]